MCANEVQFQLQPAFIDGLKKRNPAQFEEYIKSGSIIANQDGTYSSADASFRTVAANGVFSTASVEGAGGVKETKTLDSATPAKGLGVEHSAAKAKEGVKEEKTVTFKLDDFVKQSGLAEDKRAELVKEFEAAGLSIDKEKGIVTYDKTKYDTAITKFAKNNRLSYLSTNEDGKAIADKLAKDGKITLNEDGGYVINGAEGKKAVDEAFPTQTQAPVETRENKSVKINTEVTTTTTEESEPVKVADDLKHNRAGRKQARKDYEAALTEWANDPENQPTMNISIARNKYSKDVAKKAAKIAKEYNNKKSDIDLLKDYMKDYATLDDKAEFGAILKMANKAPEKELLAAFQAGTKGKGIVKDLSDPVDRKNAVLYYTMQKGDFDKSVLINRMAIIDVMGDRSEKQVAKDKKEFIEDEAKRQAKAAETKQNVENTRVYFSKEARKAAAKAETNSAIEHTDIGKVGRELVMKDPGRFCTEGTAADCDFEKNGKYYKFDEGKFRDFCKAACDGSANKLGGDFGEDGNLTLREGRETLKAQEFRDEKGLTPRSIEQLIGNSNGKVSNGELNKFRHLVEKAGYSVDTNSTNVKRALHVMKGVGIGAALGFATAGLGTLAAGAVQFAGEAITLTDTVKVTGKGTMFGEGTITGQGTMTGTGTMSGVGTVTGDASLTGPASITGDVSLTGPASITGDVSLTGPASITGDVSLTGPASITGDVTLPYEDWVKTTDYYIDEFGTSSVTHNTPVSGTTTGQGTLTGDVTLNGPATVTGDVTLNGQATVTGDVTLNGQATVTGDVTLNGQATVTGEGTMNGTGTVNGEGTVKGKGTVKGEGTVEGKATLEGKEKDKKGNKHLKTAVNAAIFGGIAGGLRNALSMGKVHAKGRNFDGIVNLNKKKEKTETENKEQTLDIPQFVTREEREVQTPDKNIDNFTYKIKVSHKKGTNYNLAEDRLSIVKKMYNIQDDATANKVLEYVMTQINGYKSNPYKLNYAGDLTYHFPSEIPAGMIAGIDDTIIGTDPNTIGGFDRNQIPLGGKNGKNASEANLRKKGFIARANVITR